MFLDIFRRRLHVVHSNPKGKCTEYIVYIPGKNKRLKVGQRVWLNGHCLPIAYLKIPLDESPYVILKARTPHV